MNEFEQKLQRQPLKKIPGEWRAKILVAADVNRQEAVRAFTSPVTIRSRLLEIFWPNPRAWAGLAAVWIVILALNFSMRDKSPMVAEKTLPPSPEVIVELKKQQRLFAELMGGNSVGDADRLKIFSPKPRSKRVEILMT